ncbi:MAG: mechanosensitive ion channel [Bacteroidales bacterium]|nr:mechanosensitive ion channel [Bacteroidales bacterium]
MRKKGLIAALGVLLAVWPMGAVFKEDNLNHTLTVLLMELKENYANLIKFSGSAEKRIQEQHKHLAAQVDECNELSVMLYSQASENTFDLTFALNEITKQYERFKGQNTPYAEIKASLTSEMDRYNRLVLTLRKMPPERTAEQIVQKQDIAVALDSASLALAQADTVHTEVLTPEFVRDSLVLRMDDETIAMRDSCLFVAEQIVAYYWQQLQQIEKDNEYYQQTDELLRSAYDYAQERYAAVQEKLFVEGQGNYFKTLKRFPFRFKRALADLKSRYSLQLEGIPEQQVVSSWRGSSVYLYSFLLLLILVGATALATLIVNVGLKKTPLFRSEWFMQRKGMVIALLGDVLFGIFLLVNTQMTDNVFIQRSLGMMGEFAWLIAAIFTSLLIRLEHNQNHLTIRAYLPTLIMAFIIIYFRIIFIPNSVIDLLYPALILVFTVWQFWVASTKLKNVAAEDKWLLWAGAGVMFVATMISWAGVVMGSLLLMIWWMFQLALLETLIALSELLTRYHESHVKERKLQYRQNNPSLPLSKDPGAYIEVTWLYDFLKRTVAPQLGVLSFPCAVFMACNVFNFTTVAQDIFFKPFVHAAAEGGFSVSLFNLVVVVCLFFLFRYIVYAAKAFYRVWRTKAAIRKIGEGVAFKETDINFNLANNIITLLVWGVYAVVVFLILKIPASGLALVSTGLATGLGFAMKDILNNFFYGVQLMSGRVRVGDTVECDGIRGTVVGLSYQSTQIEAIDGSIIFFTNSDMFGKNFKNLTRNNSYQLVTFTVGVKYGTDVEKARQVILEALKPLMGKDKYGRDVVNPRKGVTVRVSNFGDSSVDLLILLYTTVDTYGSFPAAAREAIYNAFNENGIEIPFPQQDVYIKEMP